MFFYDIYFKVKTIDICLISLKVTILAFFSQANTIIANFILVLF